MKNAFWISGALLLALPVVASAQWLGVRVPPGYGSTYHHASTVEEGWQRGRADIIRSAGLKNLLDAEAQKKWEEARKQAYDNHVYGIQKYFEGREMNRHYRKLERGPRPTEQQLYRLAAEKKPKRLGIEHLDPVTGVVTWHPLLENNAAFHHDRHELDRLFAQRAIAGFLSAHELGAVRTHIHSMLAIHKHVHLGHLAPNTYMEMKRFIESLGYEALLPPG